jgi:hypothetical protein
MDGCRALLRITGALNYPAATSCPVTVVQLGSGG